MDEIVTAAAAIAGQSLTHSIPFRSCSYFSTVTEIDEIAWFVELYSRRRVFWVLSVLYT